MSFFKKIFWLVILFFGIVLYSLYSKATLYNYDVKKDYVYSFKNTLTNTKNTSGITSFLKLNVNSTILGKLLQPLVILSDGKNSIKSYLEQGSCGIRYINISSLNISHLKILAKYVNVKDYKIISFKNPNFKDKKILIIAPHPDDAEIASFGFYSKYHKNISIVTITAGDAGPNTYKGIFKNQKQAYLEKAKVRIHDSLTVPMLGQVNPFKCLNLGYFDSELKNMYENRDKMFHGVYTKVKDSYEYRKYNISPLNSVLISGADWNSLVVNIKIVLKEIKPDIILTPYPLLDAHPDHKYSSIALFEAMKSLDLKRGKLLLYTNHLVLSEYYPFGMPGGSMDLPPNFDKSLYFDNIYSYNLTPKKQKDKILALDAMSDLRMDPRYRTSWGLLRKGVKTLLKRDFLGYEYANYFRRAIRANELFFVVDFKNIDKVMKVK